MQIKLQKWINFTEVRGKTQVCSYCRQKMKKGEIGLSITKKCTSRTEMTYNIWLHLNCIEDFCETIKEGLEENEGELVCESL